MTPRPPARNHRVGIVELGDTSPLTFRPRVMQGMVMTIMRSPTAKVAHAAVLQCLRTYGQGWPDFIGDREIHDDDRAAKNEMEMRRDPGRIVNHGIHPIAHVDEASPAAEPQHEEGEPCCKNHRPFPRQGFDPSNQPLATTQPPAISIDADMVKIVNSVGTVTRTVRVICRNLNPVECSGSMNR